MDDKTYQSSELFALNDTESILKSKAGEIGRYFYHHTTKDSLFKILSADEKGNNFFFLNNIANMNDKNEVTLHESNNKKIYSFCTCCTKHEKIPLWYLYSGIFGTGARIGFTPKKMLTFLNSVDIVYPVVNNKVDYSRPLKKDVDFDFLCGWVYYIMDGNNRVLYKNQSLPVEVLTDEELKKCFFIKNYPWEYEREFRIIIYNKSKDDYEKLALYIPKEIMTSFEIMSAPEKEFTKEEKEKLVFSGIKPDKIKKSKLGIEMNLLKNNKADILSCVDKWLKEDDFKAVCEYIKLNKNCNEEKENN